VKVVMIEIVPYGHKVITGVAWVERAEHMSLDEHMRRAELRWRINTLSLRLFKVGEP
jgi:hypothetical protein